MIVSRILNNNFLMAEDELGTQQVVLGKGLRFINQVGEPLKAENIEKIFVLKDDLSVKNYAQLLQETPREQIDAVTHVIKTANEYFDGKLQDQIFMTLMDHITYAITRVRQGIVLQNRMLWEIKKFYPKEYKAALESLEYLNNVLNVNLPKEEAGNIAFHFVNAQTDHQNMENTFEMVQLQRDIFNIIQYHFNIKLDEESLNYGRFITHLQFFIHRLVDDNMLVSRDSFLFTQISNEYAKEMKCAYKIRDYILKIMNKEITDEELLYLTIHIIRIIN